MRNFLNASRHKALFVQTIIPLLLLIFSQHAYGQAKLINGRVLGADQAPLSGASVTIKGVTGGTTTDANGRYSIMASAGDSIQVTSIGYEAATMAVGSGSELNFSMTGTASTLSDVVVVGYGTVRRSNLTGAVTTVSSKDLTKLPAANLDQALQGNVPGLYTQQSDRSPGAGVSLALRGNNSFSGNAPLFIVDGFPIASGGGVNAINPNDIESVSVLKDASSVAIYGARAANGVILITTKAGKAGKNSFDVNVWTGFKSFSNPIDFMNGDQIAQMRREAYQNDNVNGGVAVFRPEEEAMLQSGKSTSWLDEVTGSGRITQNIQLAFSGGTEKTRILVSGNLYNERGVINNSDYLRGSLRLNLVQKIGDKLTLTSNNNLSVLTGRGVTGPSVLYPAYVGNPLAPIRQPNGQYYTMLIGVGNTPWANPVAYTEMIDNKYVQPVITSSLALEYRILNGLKVRTQISGELDSWKENFYVPIALSANHEESGRVANGFARVSHNTNYNWISETVLSYNKRFGSRHEVDAVAGYSAQQNRWERTQASASGFPFDIYGTWNLGASTGTPRKPVSDLQIWTMNSYIGRVIYTFDSKYIATANFRADGSSRFGSNNKWGFFPSAAFAWRASEENFIRNLNVFDDLKIRASYGLAGNANALGVYSTQARMSPASFNWNGIEAPGYYPSQLAFDNLKWETTKQFDLGIDLSILKRRLNITADYYLKNTRDLIRQLPILAVSGFQTGWANLGNLRNEGVELAIKGLIIDRELKWNATLNLATNTNKLTSLGDGTDRIGTTHFVGQPIGIGARYLIEKTGIWQTSEATQAALYGARPGNVKYNDLNKDNKIDNNDRAFYGKLFPDFYGSLTNEISYKGFDLNTFFTFEAGRTIYNGLNYKLLAGDGYDNHRIEMLNRWTPSNPTNEYPRAAIGYSNRSSMASTEFLEKADFIKLRSLTLGYTFPASVTRRISSNNLRVYVTGLNLFTITGYSGMDPEDSDLGNTARNAPYPITRTIIFGLNLGF
ncbi:TonB-dependent receptor [Terrimonas sp. NA20]|uniref:TonB-dependent receptor n=1 Tax=Terrimonas ginsenosidimutans TaxID=2908004 RepID=A0ABS9KPR0_9BACT|nr:TonB-dependent receptor [Terrimonas ginsenosidimutans]MCG2614318.1 TonB-dependent receptor [Terrimonas ginsenosidimutans]